MPEEKAKMIPETDLITYKKSSQAREEKLKKQIEELNNKTATLESSVRESESKLKAATANLQDDAEVKSVRDYLTNLSTEIETQKAQFEKDLASLKQREKGVRAKELVANYKGKGLEVDENSVLEAEDMEAYLKDKHLEFLAKENEKLKNQPKEGSPESVFESGQGGTVKKSVKDIDITTPEGQKEFEAHWNQQKAEALAKQ